MDKVYEIEFCWMTALPATVVFDGETKHIHLNTKGAKVVHVKGTTVPNILDRLVGTDTKLISCINRIKPC